MIISVNNEREKKMIEIFLSALHDEMLDLIQEEDHKKQDILDIYLSADDYIFLQDGVFHAEVIVNSAIREMEIEPYDITGICTSCGAQTDGTIDGNMIGYSEYLDMISEESIKNWKCETCFFKEE